MMPRGQMIDRDEIYEQLKPLLVETLGVAPEAIRLENVLYTAP
jgi:hypothetical protein